ncbi:MAG: site-2 protease family protein [Microthrixaceae bacterium]|nr:site-2 protease family protein [Microthrixaceae bacterium]
MKSPDPAVVEEEAAEAATAGHPRFNGLRLALLVGALGTLGLWQGWRLLAIILAIVVMIFLHELGHFVMARRAGMKVTEFFIGFGPRIWSFRRGEVEYGIKAIPAGAYVRIVGMMNIDEVPPEDEARTYRQAPFGGRFGVAVAGSTMHFMLALVLAFSAMAFYGRHDESTWAVDETTPGSAAQLAGVRAGDRVVAVAGVEVSSFDEMSEQVRRHPDDEVSLTVLRSGGKVQLVALLGAKASIIGTVGEDLNFGAYDGEVRVNSVGSRSNPNLAYEAGLRDGDVITSINGTSLSDLEALGEAADAGVEGKVVLDYLRDGRSATTTVDLGSDLAATHPVGFLGVGQEIVTERIGVVDAARSSVSMFGRTVGMTVVGIGKVFNPVNLWDFARETVRPTTATDDDKPTPAERSAANAATRASMERPVSIIGIVGLGNQLADLRSFLAFMAGVNITIGVINLIPLLPFDGGHVMVACYERIRELLRRDRRRYFVDAAKLLPVAYVVVIVMVLVGVLAGYSDIVRPIQL